VAADHLRDGGGLVFPTIPELPFDPYRAQLNTPNAIYADLSTHAYDRTLDARIYAWSRCRRCAAIGHCSQEGLARCAAVSSAWPGSMWESDGP
jgi:hypothetical protein